MNWKERMLSMEIWSDEAGVVWKEIISRWSQADYDDETKRAAHQKTLNGEWDAFQYVRDRKPLYPEIGDQLDDLYKKGAFSDDMAAKIKKVKDDNAKPE